MNDDVPLSLKSIARVRLIRNSNFRSLGKRADMRDGRIKLGRGMVGLNACRVPNACWLLVEAEPLLAGDRVVLE